MEVNPMGSLSAQISLSGLYADDRATSQALQPSQYTITLQNLPQEIRDIIWRFITKDIVTLSDQKWQCKPPTDYDGVIFSCRQFYHETRTHWRRFFLSSRQLDSFFSQPYSPDLVSSYKILSLEIPLIMPQEFYRKLRLMLTLLAPHLRELKLFFIGPDEFGVESRNHGCGNKIARTQSTSQKLVREGQGLEKRMAFIHTLAGLHNLRTLVISNINFPLMESHVTMHKPFLEKLYILGDPRSEHHVPYNRTNSGYLINTSRQATNLTDVHIGTNTVISASRIVHLSHKTLKHLTWIVPDPSRQVEETKSSWYCDTSDVLRCLAGPQAQLETLKICAEGGIYNCDHQYGTFLAALNFSLPAFVSLKTLELHITFNTTWDAQEILHCLPPSLERLYLSDRFIEPERLVIHLECIYLHNETDHLYDECHTHGRHFERLEQKRAKCLRRWHKKIKNGDLVGEHLPRRDFIPTQRGKLAFVGFEYTRVTDDGIADEQRMELLRLNGRLLDRERNRHIFPYHMPPDKWHRSLPSDNNSIDQEEVKVGVEAEIQRVEALSQEEVAHHLQTLLSSKFTEDSDYFGNECGAEEVFYKEKAVSLTSLRPKTYPVEVEVENKDDKCHWACNH